MKRPLNTRMKGLLLATMLGSMSACGDKTTDEYIQEAQQYVAEDNRAAAVLSLKSAIQADPKSAEARFELGQIYLQLKQFESAEKEFNRALDNGYSASKVLPLLTQAYHQTGAYSAISKIAHEEAGLTPVEQAEIGYFKVLSLVRLNKFEEAQTLIDELGNIETQSVFKGLTSAYTYVIQRDFETALAQVNELREQAPQNAQVLKLVAQLQLSVKQLQPAIDTFTEYAKLFPEDIQTTFVLAKLLVDSGQAKAAGPYVDRLLLVNQKNPLLNQLKAATSAALKQHAPALKHAEVALNGGVNEPSLRLIAGYSAYQLEDYESANRHLSFVAGVLPDNHPGLKLLAASQLQLGLTSEVGEVLERLDDLSEQDAPLFSKASFELLKDGFENDAKDLMQRSSEISKTAEDLTRLGLLKLSLDNLDGIVSLEEAVAKEPTLDVAQTTLGRAYLGTKQYDKALQLAKDWKANAPDDIRPYMLAGEVYSKQRNFLAAKLEFEGAREKQPNSVTPRLALVSLDLSQQKLQPAIQALDDILIEFPTNVSALATRYLIAKQQGEEANIQAKVEAAFNSDKQNIAVRLLLARIYAAEKQYSDAISLLEAISEQPDLPQNYWAILGQSYLRTNQVSKATKHYDTWLNAEPNNKDANIGKLLLLDNRFKYEEALAMTSTFLSHRDDLQMNLLHLHFLLMNSDYTEARKAYSELPSSVLNQPSVKGFLARLQLADNQPKKALANANIAYQASPTTRNLKVLLAAYSKLSMPEKRMQILEQHVASQPKDQLARMMLADLQIVQNTQAAIASYTQAVEQNDKNYVAHNNLAYLYLQDGELGKAKAHGKKAVALQPNNPATLDTLAQVYMAEEEFEDAVALYNKAVTDEMQNEEIYLNYVEALFAADQAFLANRKLAQREYTQPESIQRVTQLKTKYPAE